LLGFDTSVRTFGVSLGRTLVRQTTSLLSTFARLLTSMPLPLRLPTIMRRIISTILPTVVCLAIFVVPLPLLLMRRPGLFGVRLLSGLLLGRWWLHRSRSSPLYLLPRRILSGRRRPRRLRDGGDLWLRRRRLLNRLRGDIEIKIILSGHIVRQRIAAILKVVHVLLGSRGTKRWFLDRRRHRNLTCRGGWSLRR
jgi:hypothetical protein